jgi:hypothetical protein
VFITPSPQANGRRPLTQELVPRYPFAGVSSRFRFLPWWDVDQPVTPEIRRNLRLMLRDDAVKPALLTKLFSVSSLDWQMQPADADDPRSKLVADFALYCARRQDGGTRGMVQEVLLAGCVDGISVCETVLRDAPQRRGKWAGKTALRCLKAKEDARPEEDRFGNLIGVWAPTEGGWESLPPDRFVVFKFMPLFGRPVSDLQAAYRLYVARDTLYKLWLIGLEKFEDPVVVGYYTAGDEKFKNDLATTLEGLKARRYVVLPDGSHVDFVQAARSGSAAYQACYEKLTEGIFLSINGAFLQSLTSGSVTTDPRGNSETQRGTFELFVWDLASAIADATNQKVWPLLTEINFVDADPPLATLGGVNDSDLLPSAQLDQLLVQNGLPLSKKKAYEYYGRSAPEGPDDALTGPPQPPAGGGGGFPFSEAAEFCGGKGGKPGPCPKGGAQHVAAATDHARSILSGGNVTPRHVHELGQRLAGMTRSDIVAVKKELGVKAGGPKAEMARKVAERALAGKAPATAAPAPPAPAAPAAPAAKAPTPANPPGFPKDDAPRQRTPAQLDRFNSQVKGTLEELPKQHRSALRDYTKEKVYAEVNAELRSGTPGPNAGRVARMRAAFDSVPPLKTPVTVYRGVALDEAGSARLSQQIAQAKANGGVMEMQGFVSTSADIGTALDFAKGKKSSVVFEISAKKGIGVDGLSKFAEHELLLDHQSKFKIVGVKQVPVSPGVTRRVVQLEQVL